MGLYADVDAGDAIPRGQSYGLACRLYAIRHDRTDGVKPNPAKAPPSDDGLKKQEKAALAGGLRYSRPVSRQISANRTR